MKIPCPDANKADGKMWESDRLPAFFGYDSWWYTPSAKAGNCRHPFSLSVFIRHQKAIPDCPSIRIPNHFQKSVAVHQFIVLIGIPDCVRTTRKGQIDASLLYIFLWQQIEHGQPRFIGGQAYLHFTIRSFCSKRFCCKRGLILHLAHLAFKLLWKTVPLSIHDTNMLRLFHLFQIFQKISVQRKKKNIPYCHIIAGTERLEKMQRWFPRDRKQNKPWTMLISDIFKIFLVNAILKSWLIS